MKKNSLWLTEYVSFTSWSYGYNTGYLNIPIISYGTQIPVKIPIG